MFCEECLADMAQHPVKPGTPVQLPVRPAQVVSKRTSRKKEVTVETQLARQRAAIAWLCGLLLASWVGLGVTVAMLFQGAPAEDPQFPMSRSTTLITGDERP